MILIVLGHVLRFGVLHNVVYYFHVPAFFFISGITIQNKPLNRAFFVSQFKKLMIPYYFFGIISIVVYGVLGKLAAGGLDIDSNHTLFESIKALLCCDSILPFNGPLWFLPALFVTKILYQLLYTWLRGNKVALLSLIALGCFLGYAYTVTGSTALPLSLELVLKLCPFFLAGQMCRTILINIGNNQSARIKCAFAAAFIVPVICTAAAFAPPINYTNNQIPSPVLFYAIAAVGCIGLFCASVSIQQAKWLEIIGRKTMPILVMHKFPVVFFQVIAPCSVWLKRADTLAGVFVAVLVSALSIALCMAVGHVIERFCPILLGVSQKDSMTKTVHRTDTGK